MAELTQLLEKAHAGDRTAWDLVYRIAGPKLRSIAAHLLRRETSSSLYQPTALVGESWLRLFRSSIRFQSRSHFYSLSSRAMTQTLIDAARRNGHRVGRNTVALDDSNDSRLLMENLGLGHSTQVRLTFERLRKWDPKAAETLWLRFVEGLTIPETARQQRRPEFKVREDCDFGLKWMADQLR